LTRTLGELRPAFDLVPGRRIGYVTDIRYTEANVQALEELLAGVDLLFIECVFMQSEADHAARKNHLTAQQAGTIARRVGAHAVVPLHFSPRYEGRGAELVAELHAAWQGAATTSAAAAETH
jgi:ribonuclease Z